VCHNEVSKHSLKKSDCNAIASTAALWRHLSAIIASPGSRRGNNTKYVKLRNVHRHIGHPQAHSSAGFLGEFIAFQPITNLPTLEQHGKAD
jgi:hypothetical protein